MLGAETLDRLIGGGTPQAQAGAALGAVKGDRLAQQLDPKSLPPESGSQVAQGQETGPLLLAALRGELEQPGKLLLGHDDSHRPGVLVHDLEGPLPEGGTVKGHVRPMDGDPGVPPGGQVCLPVLLPVQGPEPQIHVLPPVGPLPPPGLAGQGGDGVVQVGVVPLEDHVEALSVPGQAGNGGVVRVGQGVPVLRLYPPDIGQKLADGGAVAEQGHRLVRVFLRDGPDGALHPLPHLAQALPAGGPPGGVAAVKEGQPLPVGLPDLSPGAVLPVPHVDLPQAGVGVQR